MKNLFKRTIAKLPTWAAALLTLVSIISVLAGFAWLCYITEGMAFAVLLVLIFCTIFYGLIYGGIQDARDAKERDRQRAAANRGFHGD